MRATCLRYASSGGYEADESFDMAWFSNRIIRRGTIAFSFGMSFTHCKHRHVIENLLPVSTSANEIAFGSFARLGLRRLHLRG